MCVFCSECICVLVYICGGGICVCLEVYLCMMGCVFVSDEICVYV